MNKTPQTIAACIGFVICAFEFSGLTNGFKNPPSDGTQVVWAFILVGVPTVAYIIVDYFVKEIERHRRYKEYIKYIDNKRKAVAKDLGVKPSDVIYLHYPHQLLVCDGLRSHRIDL